jgi:HEAT repeat protein
VLASVLYLRIETQPPAAQQNRQSRGETPTPAPPASSLAGREDTGDPPDLPRLVDRIRSTNPASTTELDGALKGCLEADPLRRIGSVRSLGQVHSKTLVPLLVTLLGHDPDAQVRIEAAAVLEAYDSSPAASLALVDALKDQSGAVREHALLSLRVHRNEKVQTALQQQLKKGSLPEEVREAVAVFLDRYYPPLDPLADPLKPVSGS